MNLFIFLGLSQLAVPLSSIKYTCKIVPELGLEWEHEIEVLGRNYGVKLTYSRFYWSGEGDYPLSCCF
jgi:hypothetical protein